MDELTELRGKLALALREIGELHMLNLELSALAEARGRALFESLNANRPAAVPGGLEETADADPTPLPTNRAARRRAARASTG